MRLKVAASGSPLVLVVEPYGSELELREGEHVIFEWQSGEEGRFPEIRVSSDSVVFFAEVGQERLWNSDGVELSLVDCGPL